MSGIRLDKLLSNLGYGSRKEVGIWARQGRIVLRGDALSRADHAVALEDVANGDLTLDGERLDPPSPFTLMLHKPAGYICSHDEKGRLIYDLLPARWQQRKPQLSCAGRLDKESTGQVILTDDGELLHRIIHPRSHATKYYEVMLAEPLQGSEAALFATGEFRMQGDMKPLKPATWSPTSDRSGVMALQEGRFHQIRRMFETLGNRVLTLHRFQTGRLALEGLGEGEYRILTPGEMECLLPAV